MLLVAVPPWPVAPTLPLIVRVTTALLASGERAVKLILGGSASSELTATRWVLALAIILLGLSLVGASIVVVLWRASRRNGGSPAGARGVGE